MQAAASDDGIKGAAVPEQFLADLDVLAGLVREALPTARSVSIGRASGGRVAVVYRARVDGVRYYLRLAEEPGQDLGTDALILERLRTLDVRVPGVVAASAATAAFPRSWMIMREVPGRSIAQDGTDDEARQAALAAGRDAAVINSMPVSGFGWLERDGSSQLTAGLPSYRQFAVSYLPEPWPGRLGEVFDQRQLDALHALAVGQQDGAFGVGHLVHGDLDVTHIYSHAGRYSGIIDFGEMRGADPYFDLGHFLLHDGETRPVELFRSFLNGYRQVNQLPDDHGQAIRVSAILLGLRQLSHWLSPERDYSLSRPLVQRRVRELSNLIDGKSAHSERLALGWREPQLSHELRPVKDKPEA
jgi:aminoglycoside phosphotransferase (APT) family kinase protein